jgi:cell division protein FtsL
MAAYKELNEKTYNKKLTHQAYVDGSAVRKPAYKPEQAPEKEREQQRQPKRDVNRRPLVGFRRTMDFFTMSVFGISLAIVLVFAIRYLRVHAEVTELNKTLTNLTKEYETVKGENDSLLFDIADDINLNEVYEIAVGQLGMVYPNNNQVVEFVSAGDGYVRQYDNIPDAAEEGTVDTVTQVLRRLLR